MFEHVGVRIPQFFAKCHDCCRRRTCVAPTRSSAWQVRGAGAVPPTVLPFPAPFAVAVSMAAAASRRADQTEVENCGSIMPHAGTARDAEAGRQIPPFTTSALRMGNLPCGRVVGFTALRVQLQSQYARPPPLPIILDYWPRPRRRRAILDRHRALSSQAMPGRIDTFSGVARRRCRDRVDRAIVRIIGITCAGGKLRSKLAPMMRPWRSLLRPEFADRVRGVVKSSVPLDVELPLVR